MLHYIIRKKEAGWVRSLHLRHAFVRCTGISHMKSFQAVPFWMAAVFASTWSYSHTQFRADPTDDFSFTFVSMDAAASSFGLMKAADVERVLKDRLDLFPQSQIPELARHLVALCETHRFDPAFVLSLMHVESSFRIKVRSPVGAVGLMQLMPATAAVVSKKYNIRYTGARSLEDPFTNLSLGVAYLGYLRDRFQANSPYFHVAAYNVGPTRMRELMKRDNFRPTDTLVYYKKIKAGMHDFRHYETRAGRKLAAKISKENSKKAKIVADEIRVRQSRAVAATGASGV